MIRALKTALTRRRLSPPRGATYVFTWIPPDQLHPAPRGLFDGDGCWRLISLGCFLAGTEDRLAAGFCGPAATPEADFLAFAWGEFGEKVTLTPFGTQSGVPGYWVTPSGDEPGPDPDALESEAAS